jgi:hypothetical protein
MCFRGGEFLNMPDKPEAALMQRPNESLVVAVVTKRSPGAIDTATERGLGDDPAVPDRFDKLILADNPAMVTHEVNDEIEHLRLDMDGLAESAQLLLAEVDFELGKSVFHYRPTVDAIRDLATIRRLNDTNRSKTTLPKEKQKSSEELRQA